jgi:N-acyl-D-amino-acid deacylase
MPRDTGKAEQDILLKGGLIVDGAGRKAFTGNLLIRAGRIHRISTRPIRFTGASIDCSTKVVAPGFIDAHSHLDWHLPIKGHEELKWPFIAQGITTVVAGNCGISAAGFRDGTAFKPQIANHLLKNRDFTLDWDSVEDFFSRLASQGLSHNLALLAGHGSLRCSIRGLDPSPLHPYESAEMLRLLEKAMEQGARGLSLGLQYEPGMFARPEEIKEMALAVKRRGKIVSIHARALSALSGAYPVKLFGRPHNIIALEEAIDLARLTGVRLQISHLIFAGSRTWKTVDAALRLIEGAIAEGIDARFDMYPYFCGSSHINVLMPPWFLARLPGAYDDPAALKRLRRELVMIERLLGFGPGDVQITDAREPELKKYDGMFLSQIARAQRMRPEEALIDFAKKSGGRAGVLCHRYSNPGIVEALIRHPASLFMTDAWVEPGGAQNPSAFGAFPRFLRLAREKRLLSLEEAVRKMTGATAERFGLTDRGVLAEGMAADVTVFDWEGVTDNGSSDAADASPSGIDYVFVNGKKAVDAGRRVGLLNAGVPLPG